MADEIWCACVARDGFECVARRYNRSELEVRESGEEPCECSCHDDDDEDGCWNEPWEDQP